MTEQLGNVIVSADCHAGASIEAYKSYLERRYWDEFDSWAKSFVNPFSDLDEIYADRNWDSAKRVRDLDEDGVVAEVIFPNTVPPFYPANGIVAGPPAKADYERRWAGLKAHNRWLVDFCADAPGRRAGVAQLMFNEPDDAVAEIEWARAHGLTGGVLIPSIPPGAPIEPIWNPKYDEIWAACQDLDVPVNHHGGTGTPDYGWTSGMARVLYITEFTFYSSRSVWHLAWAGVFERFPRLRYVITEQGYGQILQDMDYQDGLYYMMKNPGEVAMAQGAAELVGDYLDSLPMSPGDYVRRNCWIGASFMNSWEVSQRERMGVDRLMWGCDYPHTEATWPNSRQSIAEAVAGIPVSEARKMLGLNAVDFYGFDLDQLQNLAAEFGPRDTDLFTPTVVG